MLMCGTSRHHQTSVLDGVSKLGKKHRFWNCSDCSELQKTIEDIAKRVPSPFHHPVYKNHRRSLAWSCSTATILSEDVSISLVWLGGYVKFEGLLLMLLHYVTMCTIKKIETLTQEVSHSQPTGSWQGKKNWQKQWSIGNNSESSTAIHSKHWV